MSFQVTVLKVLASYPDGFASLNNLKHDMAILANSEKDWTEQTKRLGLEWSPRQRRGGQTFAQ